MKKAPASLAIHPQENNVLHYTNLVWQVVGFLMLFSILLDALACEIRQRHVPLTHVVLLLVVGLLWHGVGMAQPGEGFFGAQTGPAGVLFAAMGAVTALVICLPLVPLGVLRMSQAWLAAGVGAFTGFQAVLDVVLFGVIMYVLLYIVASATGPGYQAFMRQLAHALEHVVPGSRGTVARQRRALTLPTSLVMASALGLYGVWIGVGLAPIVRF